MVVYSVVDRRSLKVAEETLLYLWKSDYMATHGVILVGNKVDLERKREVPSVGEYMNFTSILVTIRESFLTESLRKIWIESNSQTHNQFDEKSYYLHVAHIRIYTITVYTFS